MSAFRRSTRCSLPALDSPISWTRTPSCAAALGIFYNANGNGGALYRLHRQLPFGATNSPLVNELSATYLTVAQGLPLNPSLNVNSIINNPSGNLV